MLAGLLGSKAILYAAAAAVLAAIIGAAYLSYQHTLAQMQALAAANAVQAQQLTQAQAVNQANVAQVAQIKASSAATVAALASETAALAARLHRSAALNQEITDAPATDDGPVAPVLRRALDGLLIVAPAAATAHH